MSVAGCSSGGSDGAEARAQARVVVRDFHISAPRHLTAGPVRLSIRNKGPDDHEFIVVRRGDPRLPLREDGLTVDEDAVEKATAGALEPAPPGVHELRLRLRPGRYVLLCNMSGHYKAGMHRTLKVSS
jgi:uncharacterized cupredoxin-like copper-binding protein